MRTLIFVISALTMALPSVTIGSTISFNFSGSLIQVTGNSPYQTGVSYMANVSYDTNEIQLLQEGTGRRLYRLDTSSFYLNIESGNNYDLVTNGLSSYMLFEIWDNYSLEDNCGLCVGSPDQDQYNISFVENNEIIFDFSMIDSPFINGIDLSLVNSLDIPTSISSLNVFEFYSTIYTNSAGSWQITGAGTAPSAVPLPGALILLLTGLSAIFTFSRKVNRH